MVIIKDYMISKLIVEALILAILVIVGAFIVYYKYRKKAYRDFKIRHKHCNICKHWKKDTCPNSIECFTTFTKKYFEPEE